MNSTDPNPTRTATLPRDQLRGLTLDTIEAAAGLAPFAIGTGTDSHGTPVSNGPETIRRALEKLRAAGQAAGDILLLAPVLGAYAWPPKIHRNPAAPRPLRKPRPIETLALAPTRMPRPVRQRPAGSAGGLGGCEDS